MRKIKTKKIILIKKDVVRHLKTEKMFINLKDIRLNNLQFV